MKRLSSNQVIGRVKHPSGSVRLLGVTAVLLAVGLSFGAPTASAADAPLVLEKSIAIPGVPTGPYSDFVSLDVAGGRDFFNKRG